jgi:hypothetical protein
LAGWVDRAGKNRLSTRKGIGENGLTLTIIALGRPYWTVGDPINNLTRQGNTPYWSTVSQRYWKNEAYIRGRVKKEGARPRLFLGCVSVTGSLLALTLIAWFTDSDPEAPRSG